MAASERPRADPERVLILAPTGRDAALTATLLEKADLRYEVCRDMNELARKVREGAGAALIAEEALIGASTAELDRAIADQPAWSDFPFVVFGVRRESTRDAEYVGRVAKKLGNVTLLDRPVHVRTMIAAVEAALRARRRQYEAQREIDSRDQFLAMLGHELRNPLAALVVASEILERDLGPKTQRAQRAVVQRHVNHLARLVDDLLDVARVAAGKITLERVPLELNELLASCIESVEPAARQQGVEIGASYSNAPLFVDGDRVRLEQVFANLLTNAVKYTTRGGFIRVQVERSSDRAIVRVTDSGIGIDRDMLERVFDLFAQADRSLERSRGGLGIGLTLVQNLVRLHAGEVRAESPGSGQGSTFVVALPLGARPVAAPAPPARPASHEQPALRLVVVEDNDDLREGLVDLLELSGYRVESASNGLDGVSMIGEAQPFAALVDIGLPGLDGYEVARRVRETLGRRVRLIALTGYGQPEDRRRALEAGFDAHVTKPVRVDDLKQLLDPGAEPTTAGGRRGRAVRPRVG